jgi:hypothetical protein
MLHLSVMNTQTAKVQMVLRAAEANEIREGRDLRKAVYRERNVMRCTRQLVNSPM